MRNKFIILGNSSPPASKYTRRSHRKNLFQHEALIRQWHQQGFTISDMLDMLANLTDHPCSPSKNQLFSQIRSWGLSTYRPRWRPSTIIGHDFVDKDPVLRASPSESLSYEHLPGRLSLFEVVTMNICWIKSLPPVGELHFALYESLIRLTQDLLEGSIYSFDLPLITLAMAMMTIATGYNAEASLHLANSKVAYSTYRGNNTNFTTHEVFQKLVHRVQDVLDTDLAFDPQY